MFRNHRKSSLTMCSNCQPFENYQEDTNTTSTPKRRRLGTGRILLRPKNHVDSIINDDFPSNCSPINCKTPRSVESSSDRSESPYLPCNQAEYLCNDNISSSDEIPCSSGISECSLIRDVENLKALVVSTSRIENQCNQEVSKMDTIEEFDEITENMFNSKLEQSNSMNQFSSTFKMEKNFKDNVEYSFDKINQSICQLTEYKKCDKGLLFESKDSFLLDIKESGTVVKESRPTYTYAKPKDVEGFYGLPMITKGLFKNYRNIEKFYGELVLFSSWYLCVGHSPSFYQYLFI